MRRAEALVFPSRYEGFGLPVLEAQHLGVPVIASTAPALQEVTGGAAVHISPDDRDGWAEALSVPWNHLDVHSSSPMGTRTPLASHPMQWR